MLVSGIKSRHGTNLFLTWQVEAVVEHATCASERDTTTFQGEEGDSQTCTLLECFSAHRAACLLPGWTAWLTTY